MNTEQTGFFQPEADPPLAGALISLRMTNKVLNVIF